MRIASCSRFNATLKDDISIALGERLALSAAYGMIIAAGRIVYLSTYEYFSRTKAVTITPPRLHRFLLVAWFISEKIWLDNYEGTFETIRNSGFGIRDSGFGVR